jgi:hypothetical protein
MNRTLVNLLAVQISWFASVLGAAYGMPYLGPVFVAVWLPLHIVATKSSARIELMLILAAGALGYLLDSMLVLAGFMSFPPQAQLGAPSTLWMVTLWLGFAATLRHALGWLRGRLLLGALLGAIVGPFAYWSGSELGAVVLADTTSSLIAVGMEWLIAMPVLLAVTGRLERIRSNAESADASAELRQECG